MKRQGWFSFTVSTVVDIDDDEAGHYQVAIDARAWKDMLTGCVVPTTGEGDVKILEVCRDVLMMYLLKLSKEQREKENPPAVN